MWAAALVALEEQEEEGGMSMLRVPPSSRCGNEQTNVDGEGKDADAADELRRRRLTEEVAEALQSAGLTGEHRDADGELDGFALMSRLRGLLGKTVGEELHALCVERIERLQHDCLARRKEAGVSGHDSEEHDIVASICEEMYGRESFRELEDAIRSCQCVSRQPLDQLDGDNDEGPSAEASGGDPALSVVAPHAKTAAPSSLVSGIVSRRCDDGRPSSILHSWPDGVVLADVLSATECDSLVSATELSNLYSFWHPDGSTESNSTFRRADTIEIVSDELAGAIWSRIAANVPPTVEVIADGRLHERGCEGEWDACGVNPTLLFVRYREGDHFSPHTDGHTIVDFNTRSFYSVLVYLNDNAHGGRTRFMEVADAGSGAEGTMSKFVTDGAGRYRFPESEIVSVADVVRGSACIFKQDVPHEGEPVALGKKYIIRTDVYYTRRHPKFTSDKDKEAFRLFREADLMEADGHAIEAARKYRHACRLSPSLASVYGL